MKLIFFLYDYKKESVFNATKRILKDNNFKKVTDSFFILMKNFPIVNNLFKYIFYSGLQEHYIV